LGESITWKNIEAKRKYQARWIAEKRERLKTAGGKN